MIVCSVAVARTRGYYPASSSDRDFSFSDVYDPVTFSGARACEARVWSFFSAVLGGAGGDFYSQYLDYAQGYNLTNRMPLWVKPAGKIDLASAFHFMRNHFESTWLDMQQDVGRPLTQ